MATPSVGPKEFLVREGLLVNLCPPNRHRALTRRLTELGIDVRRVVKRRNPRDQWEAHVVTDFGDDWPPPVAWFRVRLRQAPRALGSRRLKAKMRIALRASGLTTTFPWPKAET